MRKKVKFLFFLQLNTLYFRPVSIKIGCNKSVFCVYNNRLVPSIWVLEKLAELATSLVEPTWSSVFCGLRVNITGTKREVHFRRSSQEVPLGGSFLPCVEGVLLVP